MKCRNFVSLKGYIGQEPKVKNLPGGALVATFSLATKERWKDRKTGQWKEHLEWHNVQAWAYLAERVERDFKKGSYIDVEGKIVTEHWVDKEGVDQYRKVIKAGDLDLLEKRGRADYDKPTDSDGAGEKGEF